MRRTISAGRRSKPFITAPFDTECTFFFTHKTKTDLSAGQLRCLTRIFDARYYFLHARLINPPPGFYENVVVINTPRCRPRRIRRFPRRARNAGTESFHLTSDPAGGERGGGGGGHTLARATKRKKEGRREAGEKNRRNDERKKREKRQRTGVGGACASMHRGVRSHGVASRRQASSVARRAPSHSHVTPHLVARAQVMHLVSRTFLSPDRRLSRRNADGKTAETTTAKRKEPDPDARKGLFHGREGIAEIMCVKKLEKHRRR